MRFFQLLPVCGAVMEAPGHSYTYFMLVILRGPTVPAPRDDGKSLGTFWLSPQRMLLAYGGKRPGLLLSLLQRPEHPHDKAATDPKRQ